MKKLNNKGFTLIEILMGFIIGSIVILIATTAILSMYSSISRQEKLNNNKMISDSIFSFVCDELECASNVQILNSDSIDEAKYENILEIKDGIMMLNGMPLNEKSLDKKIELTAQADRDVINLNLAVNDEMNMMVYSNRSDFKVNLLGYDGRNVEGAQGTAIINPIISFDNKKKGESGLITMPNELYWKMYNMRDFYYSLTADEKRDIKIQMTGNPDANDWWGSNDFFRTYLKIFHYKNEWPKVDLAKETGFPKLPYASGTTLYYQPFMYNPGNQSGLPQVCVYISNTTENGRWTSYMIFSYSEQTWYYTSDARKGISIANGSNSWEATKQMIIDKGWTKLEL